MWSVARRPRWIGMLFLALVIAAGFAALGQWQLGRAVSNGTVLVRDTEKALPLDSIAAPRVELSDKGNGQSVSANGTWVPRDYVVLSDRLNGSKMGWWVVGHLSADVGKTNPVGLAVAMGWAPTRAAAVEVKTRLSNEAAAPGEVTGRYLPSESPEDNDFEHGKRSSVAVSDLLNTWHVIDKGGVYGGYVVDYAAASGLDKIDSPVPTQDVSLNWLNLFYAVEWVVFAGFAVFLWYRLVRDTWEREQEEAAAESADVN